ncbi:MAG: hypothetical protein FWE71_09865 [Nocardioidaceae bacterium]|nr:hypothetical protein [Nocardioidaceae bacterium]MCL2611933.1 hypothetical protein [Nocardioidaceae bacterium]
MIGRRRPDVTLGQLPNELQHGDYWKYVDKNGEPLRADCGLWKGDVSGNLTGGVWGYYSPDGNGCGTLVRHTVREHEDGTISIRPGDGSSNSILHSGGRTSKVWHGYVDHGDWQEC